MDLALSAVLDGFTSGVGSFLKTRAGFTLLLRLPCLAASSQIGRLRVGTLAPGKPFDCSRHRSCSLLGYLDWANLMESFAWHGVPLSLRSQIYPDLNFQRDCEQT